MTTTDSIDCPKKDLLTPATGLFGWSVSSSKEYYYAPTASYIRDIEQMPNFTPPSTESFVARYVSSNIASSGTHFKN